MKNQILVMILFFIISANLQAGSVGGFATQGKGNIGVSLEIDYIFEKNLELDGIDLGLAVIDVEAKDHLNVPVKVAFGLTDSFDLYGKLAYSDFDNEGMLPALGGFVAESDPAAAYSIGVKGVHKAENNILYGIDLQYSYSENDNEISIAGGAVTDTGEVEYNAFHVASFIGYQTGQFIPYAGLRYSEATYEHDFATLGRIDFEADDNIGVFAGTDFLSTDDVTLNIEARFIDATALTISALRKF